MNPTIPLASRLSRTFHPLIRAGSLALLLFLSAPRAPGQTPLPERTGNSIITGRVSNGGTKAYLEGALVVLKPGDQSVLTTSTGAFLFSRVPAGDYTLAASYAGLDPQAVSVTVGPNGRSENEIQLTSEIYSLEKYVVAGEREGNAAAITQQRNADNIKTVMASDAFGNVADLNIVNFLMRMPGVTKTEVEGEPSGISIRGISNELSMVTVDGEQGSNASYRGLSRGYEADKISADFIESIEVVKSLTPDMDAGAVGGIVNMKTKSALTRKGRHINFQAGEGYNVWKNNYRPFGTLSYSDVFGADQKLGVLVSASYSKANKPRDNSNMLYEQTTATNRPIFFYATTWGEDLIEVNRTGLSLRFDYKLAPQTTVFATVMYSYYTSTLNRHRGSLSAPTTANLVSLTDTVTETRNQSFNYTQIYFNRVITTYNFMVGGESRLWGGKLDFQGTVSPSFGDEVQFSTPKSVGGVQLRQDRSLTHNDVIITQTGGPDIFTPQNMTMSVANPELANHERVIGAQANFSKPFALRWPFVIKTGLRYRSVQKEIDQTNHTYSYVGPNGIVGPVGAANDDHIEQFLDANYHHKAFNYPTDLMPFVDQAKLQQAMAANPSYFPENIATSVQNSVTNDVKLTEDISAAYLMGTLKLGRLTTVGGLRFEDTKMTGKGYKNEISKVEAARRAAFVGPITPEETARRTLAQFGNPVTNHGGYHYFFPSANAKYLLTPQLLARASYASSIGRPNLGSIRPTTTVDVINERITANNPNLHPQRANNFDVSLEYYFKSTGVFSVGVFQKNLRDFIFPATSALRLEPGNPYGDEYVGYSLTTSMNGGKAWVRGLEVSWQQQLSNSGAWSFLRPFGFFANFTWLQTQGNYTSATGVAGTGDVAGFTPRSGNLGLSYIAHGLTLRVLEKYESARLEVYNANADRREYFNNSFPVDLNVAYAMKRNLSLFVDVINVFNTRTQDRYLYVPDRPSRTIIYSTYIKAGVSGRF